MTTPTRSAVVFGGTGYVGSHVVRTLLAQGASVLVPSRRATGVETLGAADTPGELLTMVADVSTPDGAHAVGDRLLEIGGVDLALAAIGGWWEGPHLADLTYETWAGLLASHLTAHFLAAQATLPSLRDHAAYVAMNGIAALQPEPGSGPVSVTGVAQTMLLDVFRAEGAITRGTSRWHEVSVVNPIVGDGLAELADEAVVEIGDVVTQILELVEHGPDDTHRLTIGKA